MLGLVMVRNRNRFWFRIMLWDSCCEGFWFWNVRGVEVIVEGFCLALNFLMSSGQ